MKPDTRFLNLPLSFWADVRTISEAVGYTDRRTKEVRVASQDQIISEYRKLGFTSDHLFLADSRPTHQGEVLLSYLNYRARILDTRIERNLMNAEQAKTEFERLRRDFESTCPLPFNKQKGDKRAHAYLTCIVNMLIEANAQNHPCDYDPRKLTKFTRNRAPLRTFSRRIDGAFPSVIDPIAMWEIKEYYYTTTFGSRVADAVYETLLDGMERTELSLSEGIKPLHYLFVDSHSTWWEQGRSYLCRLIDALHMGYVDEILFGRETVSRLPELVENWIRLIQMS